MRNRNRWGVVVAAAVIVSASCAVDISWAQNKARPNLVLILTDDQAADCLAAWGTWGNDSSVLQTPNLDRLVQRGTSFRNAYNMGAYTGAVCVTSRSMLFTGRYLWATERAADTEFRELIESQRSWPQRLHQAGYATYFAGKWHVAASVDSVFDAVRHVRPGMPKTVESAYHRPAEGSADTWLPWDVSNGGYWEGGKHWSEVLAEDATELLRRAAERPEPFFLYLGFNAPHDPRQSPREYLEQYPISEVPLPQNFQSHQPFHQAMGLGPLDHRGLRDETLAPFPRTPESVRVHRQEYYALVSHTDRQVGRILDALDDFDLADNTVVAFTSDHGLAVGRHGLMGKQNMYEHSLRVPLVITGPGFSAGRSIESRVYMQDIMATMLELAGADDADLDFQSLMPLVRGDTAAARPSIYAAYLADRQRAIVSGSHKLILYPTIGKSLLFDLSDDPLELRDLAEQPESFPVQRRLFDELQVWQARTDDRLDLEKAFPDLVTASGRR